MRLMNARNATLKTVSAELKALTVEGRQVTLSVFRQLIRADVLDRKTGDLLGVPWGTVNYFWGDCSPDHLHVVWQDGENLRRDCLRKVRAPQAAQELRDDAADIYSWLRLILDFEFHTARRPEGSEAKINGWAVTIPSAKACPACSADKQIEAISRRARYSGHTEIEHVARQRSDIEYERRQPHDAKSGYYWGHAKDIRRAELVSDNQDMPARDMMKELIDAYWATVKNDKSSDAAWARNYKMVEGLDQLFIAV